MTTALHGTSTIPQLRNVSVLAIQVQITSCSALRKGPYSALDTV